MKPQPGLAMLLFVASLPGRSFARSAHPATSGNNDTLLATSLSLARRKNQRNCNVVPRAGVEPATYPLGGDRSIQLSYRGVLACYCIVQMANCKLFLSSWGAFICLARVVAFHLLGCVFFMPSGPCRLFLLLACLKFRYNVAKYDWPRGNINTCS